MVTTPQLRDNDLLYEVAAVVAVPCVEQFYVKFPRVFCHQRQRNQLRRGVQRGKFAIQKSLINRILNS